MSDLIARLRTTELDDHARGCEGRQYTCTCGFDDRLYEILEEAADALTTAQAEAEAQKQRIGELEAENARLRETLGTICKDSNPDWTEKRAYPECVLDDIHEMAVKAYYELKS